MFPSMPKVKLWEVPGFFVAERLGFPENCAWRSAQFCKSRATNHPTLRTGGSGLIHAVKIRMTSDSNAMKVVAYHEGQSPESY